MANDVIDAEHFVISKSCAECMTGLSPLTANVAVEVSLTRSNVVMWTGVVWLLPNAPEVDGRAGAGIDRTHCVTTNPTETCLIGHAACSTLSATDAGARPVAVPQPGNSAY